MEGHCRLNLVKNRVTPIEFEMRRLFYLDLSPLTASCVGEMFHYIGITPMEVVRIETASFDSVIFPVATDTQQNSGTTIHFFFFLRVERIKYFET